MAGRNDIEAMICAAADYRLDCAGVLVGYPANSFHVGASKGK